MNPNEINWGQIVYCISSSPLRYVPTQNALPVKLLSIFPLLFKNLPSLAHTHLNVYLNSVSHWIISYWVQFVYKVVSYPLQKILVHLQVNNMRLLKNGPSFRYILSKGSEHDFYKIFEMFVKFWFIQVISFYISHEKQTIWTYQT